MEFVRFIASATRLATCKEIQLHSWKLYLFDMSSSTDSLKGVPVTGSKLDFIITYTTEPSAILWTHIPAMINRTAPFKSLDQS